MPGGKCKEMEIGQCIPCDRVSGQDVVLNAIYGRGIKGDSFVMYGSNGMPLAALSARSLKVPVPPPFLPT